MDILSDAEYSRLTPIEKAQYWHARYQDENEKHQKLQERERKLQQFCDLVRDALSRT